MTRASTLSRSVAAVGLTFASTTSAVADWNLPHVLEASGRATAFGSTFTFDTTVFVQASGSTSGPDAQSRRTYAWDAPLQFSFDDAGGRTLGLEFAILSGETVPEADGFRTTIMVAARWNSCTGGGLNIPIEDQVELSVFGYEPEPIGIDPARLAFPMPPLQFVGTDDLGQPVALELNAGTLVIPAPAGSAVLMGAGGLACVRRRRGTEGLRLRGSLDLGWISIAPSA